ncbi:hypothetical protein AAG570_008843 [Ranatra chinensis]|uniref:Major facilitator superfamily (MFS) profile domain-containing protein n=1 Tax=Ranatra chinensis TaxID=642074 RepID=A0ABD0YS31_9HEMI
MNWIQATINFMFDAAGEFGKYQVTQFLLHILAAFTAGIHMMSLVTVAAVPQHRCAIPGFEDNGTRLNWDSSIVSRYIPTRLDGSLNPCQLFNPETNETTTCSSWIYDRTYYPTSRAIDWDFVCDRRWMGAVSQSAFMFGVFAGAVTLGSMADKYGRKKIFYVSAVMQLILGVIVAFITEYYLFLAVSFAYGYFGSAGSYITGFVLSMELVGASKRTACGITFQGMFAFGLMMVAMWGYLIDDKTILQVIYGLHSVLLIGHWWLIDESPRWLWSQGRYSESIDIVERGVRMNGGVMPVRSHYLEAGEEGEDTPLMVPSYGITHMFRTPRLRMMTLNVCLNWFANSLAYYSLSLNTGQMFGNPYLMLFVMGLVEIPSYVMTVLVLDRTGRRCLTSSLMIVGGFACLLTAFLPKGWGTVSTAIIFVGKFCIAGSFAVIYNYSAELFPTVLRNTALGVGSMCARTSGALTPLITLLDSFDKRVPTVVFASVTLISGLLTTLLPETLDKPLPQSIDDGEKFGVGDTCFTTGCFGTRTRKNGSHTSPKQT